MCTTLQPSSSWDSLPLIDDLYFTNCYDPHTDYVLPDRDVEFRGFSSPQNYANNNWMPLNSQIKREIGEEPFIDSVNSSTNTTTTGYNSASPTLSASSDSNQKASKKDAMCKKLERDEHAPTVCVICLSPASCYHYQAPACNGCKTFFRRSIVLRKNYICKFDSKCDIQGGARCRACRYDRCLLAGMDAGAIKFVDSATATAVLNEVNKRKRDLKATMNENDFKNEKTLAVQTKVTPKFDQTCDSRLVDNLAYMELKLKRLRESLFNDTAYYQMNLGEILKRRSELGNADKYELPTNWPLSVENLTFGSQNIPGPRDRHWLIFDILLNIEYLKAMPFFYQLDSSDKEALIMHVVLVNTTLVQSWYSYLKNSRILVHPDGLGPLHIRPFVAVSKIYPEIIPIELDNFSRSIDPLFRVILDPEEYYLLKVIIFCHSETPGLSLHAQEMLAKEREIYAQTLMRRIQARLGTCEGARKYAEIIALIQTFFHFAQKKREFHVFIKSIMCDERPHIDPPILDWFMKNSSKF